MRVARGLGTRVANAIARLLVRPVHGPLGRYTRRVPWKAGKLPILALRSAARPHLRDQNVIAETVHGFRREGSIRVGVTALVYACRVREPRVSWFIADRLRTDTTFVDGYYTLLASRCVSSGRVVAVDPSPANVLQLERNLALNGVGNVRLVQAAVSDRDGEIQLYGYDGIGAADAMFDYSSSVWKHRGKPRSTTAPTIALETLLRSGEPTSARIVKTDIEGGEALPLSGLTALLARAPKELEFVIEIHPRFLEAAGKKPERDLPRLRVPWLQRVRRRERRGRARPAPLPSPFTGAPPASSQRRHGRRSLLATGHAHQLPAPTNLGGSVQPVLEVLAVAHGECSPHHRDRRAHRLSPAVGESSGP